MATEARPETEVLQLPSDQNHTGRDLGDDEIAAVAQAIESGTLTSTKGTFVKQLEEQFAARVGVAHAYACSSGTAALHTAVAAIDPEPGDEIITTPITDMGAVTPILYQGAIPVFADVDPKTYNLTAASIEQRISERTKAIMVTHLFGLPAKMCEIMELARSKNIPVIEDCAQAFGATGGGMPVGSIGDIGCFSLQQGKHITTGEGGLCVSNNEEYARRMFLYINKAWGYGDAKPDHYFLALNYRMNELTGAVALAQLQKLNTMVDHRVAIANEISAGLQGVTGLTTPPASSSVKHTYWKYCLSVDSDAFEGGLDALAAKLKARGVFCAPRYIQKPAFECQVIRDQVTFGKSRWPFTEARAEATDYRRELFPGTYEALATVLVLPINEKYTVDDAGAVVSVIREAAEELAK